jgi:integrase/recombinase XerC
MSTEALIVYDGGDVHVTTERWAQLSEGGRHRDAVRAAQMRDHEALWALTQSWLITHGRKGGMLSPRTLARYRRALVPVNAERSRALGLETPLLIAWRQENLLHPARLAGTRWLRALEAAGAKPSTVQVMLAAGRALYAALRFCGATEADPFKDVHPAPDPTARHEKRAAYSDDELESLLAVAEGEEQLVVLLAGYGGLRAEELCRLRWSDVDLRNRRLVVAHGKGGKQRTIPLATRLYRALGAAARLTPYVLALTPERVSEETEQSRYNRLYHRQKRLCRRAGVPERALHAARHSAGTRLYEETSDVQLVSQMLGHAQISTSTTYIKRSDRKLAAAMERW